MTKTTKKSTAKKIHFKIKKTVCHDGVHYFEGETYTLNDDIKKLFKSKDIIT